jgi:aromatic ring-cleaving dioxygenase
MVAKTRRNGPRKKPRKGNPRKEKPRKSKTRASNTPATAVGMPGTARPPAIAEYHAHVYYDPRTTRDRAATLRDRVAAAFPAARLGRWHDELVGPHPQSMYQIAFPSRLLASFLPWLMLNRDGLTVLLHPETGNDYRDHTAHAAWLGALLPLRLEVFGQHADDEAVVQPS